MNLFRRALAVVPAACLGLAGAAVVASPAHAAATDAISGDLRLIAVDANGSPDWIDIANVSGHDVTLTGWDVTDSDPVNDSHPIADGTVVSAGQTLTVQVGAGGAPDFGLGKGGDSATLRLNGTVVDTVTWTAASTVSGTGGFARCADDSAGDLTWTSATVTQAGAFTCPDAATVLAAVKSGIKVNEVVADNANGSDGKQRPDWIELTNTGSLPANLSGWWLSDDTATDQDLLPAGTTIAAGGFAAYGVGGSSSADPGVPLPWGATKVKPDFGLGAGGDQAAIVAPDGTDADRVAWGTSANAAIAAAATGDAIARDATNTWVETTTQTPAAANVITAPGAGDTGGGTATGAASDIKLNEVRSSAGASSDANDDGNDFFELINTGTGAVDLNGWTFTDGDGTAPLAIASTSTLVQPGAVFKVETGTTGLGKGDAINVADGTGTDVISFRWPSGQHATPSYARCPDGLGSYQLVLSSQATPGQVNDAGCPTPASVQGVETSSLILNEVSMNSGGGHGDFIEIKNIGSTAIDLTGLGLSDNKHPLASTPDWQPYAAGTMLAPGARLATETTFGLGGDQGDEANLWLADKSTLVDGTAWIKDGAGDGSSNAAPLPWPSTTSLGRCPDDATNVKGAWQESNTVTFGTANDCTAYVGGTTSYDPTTDGAQPWPGSSTVTTSDSADMFYLPASDDGIEETYGDASGAVFDPSDPNTLWVAKNKRGTLWKLTKQSDGSWAPAAGWPHGKDVHFVGGTGHPDTEGLTIGPDGQVYMTSERDNAHDSVNQNMVLQFDQDADSSELTATRQWDLTSALPNVPANLGLEGVTWVPDTYLTGGGLIDQSTHAVYDPATYPLHGSGLFLVAFEGDGNLYAFALNSDGSYDKVATIASGFPTVMDVQYDAERHSVWAVCDDTCSGRYAELQPSGGTLARTALFARPTGMGDYNNEGMAIAPQSTCLNGSEEVVWTDDGNDDHHSLRSGTIDCTGLPQTVSITSSTTATVGGRYTPTVTSTGGPSAVVLGASGACSLTAGVVSFDRVGTCTVTADKPASAGYEAAPQAIQTITVAAAPVGGSQPGTTQPTPVVFHPVTGQPKVGKKLKVSVTLPPGATATYQWYAGGSKIKHATKHVLKLTKALRHHRIRVRVTVRVPGQAPVVRILKLGRAVR